MGVDTNNASAQFLDVYMQGETEAWLAVGFSATRDMVSVCLGCHQRVNVPLESSLREQQFLHRKRFVGQSVRELCLVQVSILISRMARKLWDRALP